MKVGVNRNPGKGSLGQGLLEGPTPLEGGVAKLSLRGWLGVVAAFWSLLCSPGVEGTVISVAQILEPFEPKTHAKQRAQPRLHPRAGGS